MDTCACHVVFARLGRSSVAVKHRIVDIRFDWESDGTGGSRRKYANDVLGNTTKSTKLIDRLVEHSRGLMHANFLRARVIVAGQVCRMLGEVAAVLIKSRGTRQVVMSLLRLHPSSHSTFLTTSPNMFKKESVSCNRYTLRQFS